MISSDEIKIDSLFSQASLLENGIFNTDRLVKEREQDLLKKIYPR